MSNNIFFKKKGPFKLNYLFPKHSNYKLNIVDIKTLDKANKLAEDFIKQIKELL